MEHTAVQLMSRKQRAAKLLTGDVGLTGLDALTEGEGGFEAALMDAIAKDEALLDPSEMFKASASQSEIDAEDMAYWNIEVEDNTEEFAEPHADPLLETAVALGGTVHKQEKDTRKLVRYVSRYLDTVHLIHDEAKRAKLQAKLLSDITGGVTDNEDTRKIVGMTDPDFNKAPVHEEAMIRHVRGWLKRHRYVFAGCEDEAAAKIVDLAKQALGLTLIKLDIFERLQELHEEEQQTALTDALNTETAPPQKARSACRAR